MNGKPRSINAARVWTRNAAQQGCSFLRQWEEPLQEHQSTYPTIILQSARQLACCLQRLKRCVETSPGTTGTPLGGDDGHSDRRISLHLTKYTTPNSKQPTYDSFPVLFTDCHFNDFEHSGWWWTLHQCDQQLQLTEESWGPVLVSAAVTACLAGLSPSLQHDYPSTRAPSCTRLQTKASRRRWEHRAETQVPNLESKFFFLSAAAEACTLGFSLHRPCARVHLFPRMCVRVCEVSLCLHLRACAENKHGLHHSLWPCGTSRPRPQVQGSVAGKCLIGWDVAEPGQVVMATWFYLDDYSHCNTTINSLYSTL